MDERHCFRISRAMKTLEGVLRVGRRFAVVILPWSNGTCEWMMREVFRALKAILQEERCDIRECGWTWCERSSEL